LTPSDDVSPPPAREPAAGSPRPRVVRRAHYSLWMVWLIPVIAVVIGLWLGVRSVLGHGPIVTIHFLNAEGLEAGKTKIRYKAVDIGTVKTINLTPDRKTVAVTAELNNHQGVREMLVDDTKFWIVKPSVTAAGVSGLGTLLSGAYIGVDVGKSATERDAFEGLESPPAISSDVPGRKFILKSFNLGSLDVGSPIYFRRVPVGQVTSYDLDANGKQVSFGIFVNAPYDHFVTTRSRFWQASGVDVELSADGLKVTTESLASLITGGIAFQELQDDGQEQAPEAAASTIFQLNSDRSHALKQPDRYSFDYTLLFDHSVRGLSIGAPVDFRGLSIGEVTSIKLNAEASEANPNPRIAVTMRVYPDRLPVAHASTPDDAPVDQKASLNPMVQRGFRAQLRNGNLLTGQLYVALDFFQRTPKAEVDWTQTPPIFPTLPGSLDTLQDSLVSIADKIDRLPLEGIANDLQKTLRDLNKAIGHTDDLVQRVGTELTPEARGLLVQARKTLDGLNSSLEALNRTLDPKSQLQGQATKTLSDVSSAARSLRQLADELEQHPETLLRGKPKDPK
jgi:paraquat-inducible protein B